jgi:hypothetical protein
LRSDLGVRRTDANGVRLVLGHAEVLTLAFLSHRCVLKASGWIKVLTFLDHLLTSESGSFSLNLAAVPCIQPRLSFDPAGRFRLLLFELP